MNIESANNEPDPPRQRSHVEGAFGMLGPSSSHSKSELLSEQEKIKKWALKAAAASASDLDPGLIARAESFLADPHYPGDEVLETMARNLILRERF